MILVSQNGYTSIVIQGVKAEKTETGYIIKALDISGRGHIMAKDLTEQRVNDVLDEIYSHWQNGTRMYTIHK